MLCNCGQKAVYHRRYEGHFYCTNCLVRQVENKFLKTIKENNLIDKNDKIAVAVSGGKDSSVLLHLMNKFSKIKRVDIFALSVDEGIAGYRDTSIRHAKNFCKELGVEHQVASFSEELNFTLDDLKNGKFCTYCGVFRRYLLNKKARELGATKLAVGHNLDDEVQSVFMNFLRGDFGRMQRLGAFPVFVEDEKFVPRIKPLIEIPEKEIVVYANVKNIPYHDGECPHSFDNVRRDVQKIINDLEERYPGTKIQISKFYEKLKSCISKRKGAGVNYCKICEEPSSSDMCKACKLLENISDASRG